VASPSNQDAPTVGRDIGSAPAVDDARTPGSNGHPPPDGYVAGQADSEDPPGTLREQVAGGVRWGLIASIATQVGRLAFVVALMRLLGPQNFGIVGQASVYIAITYIFLHLGTAANIIQRPHLEKADVGSAWWINVALGSALAGLTVVAAPVLAGFFRTEELTAVLRALSICFVLKAMAVVPTALLYRNMRFRSIGTAEIASTFLGGALAVVAAANGAGYWALVVQTLAMDAIFLVALVRISGRPELTWSTSAARGLWSFSSRVMGAELVKYMSENTDKFIIARVLGATQLGYYSLAYRVLLLPLLMMEQAGRVILPTFSRLQNDRERLAQMFLRASESVALVVCPAMTLTILSAPIAVPAVLGDAWAPAVVPLQILAAMTTQYLILSVTPAVVLAVGRADWEFRWSIVTMVFAVVAFGVGVNWGITGVATAYLVMGLALTPIRLSVIRRIIPISARGYLRVLAPAFGCSAALCGVWLLVAITLGDTTSGLPLLACAAVAGIAAYVAAAMVLWPRDLRYQYEFARQVVSRSGT
jgi:lipopolysaccharide exporter